MFTHSIPTIPWTKCLGLSGETTMTTKSSATSLLSNAFQSVFRNTLGGARVLLTEYPHILFLGTMSGLLAYSWQYDPEFRGILSKETAPLIRWFDSQQLCGLHGGRATFKTSKHYVQANGVTCALPNHEGVLSLMQEYWDPSQRGVRFTAEGDR